MPSLGIFWFVEGEFVAAGCPLHQAAPYGDCLTYDGGHADHWERWQEAGARWLAGVGLPRIIVDTEYDEHPRGRIVKEPARFVIYADRRIQTAPRLRIVRERFGLPANETAVRSDQHYR